MNDKKILSLLGLAMRAGRLVSGQAMVEETVRACAAELVIIAGDASDNTKKTILDKSTTYETPVYIFSTMDVLGKSIGKEMRACIAVTDAGFAQKIEKLMTDSGQEVVKWQN